MLVYSRDGKQSEMQALLLAVFRYFLDVRDKDRLSLAMRLIKIIHAAASSACESSNEFIKTNVDGATNVVEASIGRGVKITVALSTDCFAVNPVNLYGATKLCSDKIFVAANSYAGKEGTIFSVVRYKCLLVGLCGSSFFKAKRRRFFDYY